MSVNVAKEVAALEAMTLGQLRAKYAELFGEPTSMRHKRALVRRIVWRLQAMAEGDISQRARRRAAELADDARLRLTAPNGERHQPKTLPTSVDHRLPAPGTVITRRYKGTLLEVTVLADGFEYRGMTFRSLSAVAKHVSGSHCNGFRFFGLPRRGGRS